MFSVCLPYKSHKKNNRILLPSFPSRKKYKERSEECFLFVFINRLLTLYYHYFLSSFFSSFSSIFHKQDTHNVLSFFSRFFIHLPQTRLTHNVSSFFSRFFIHLPQRLTHNISSIFIHMLNDFPSRKNTKSPHFFIIYT